MFGSKAGPRSSGFTLIELLVVIAIIAVLIGLLLPAVQKVRAAAARTKCSNNLKQIALACHGYHDANQSLPQSYSIGQVGVAGSGYSSWLIALLPYVEQGALYDGFHQSALASTNATKKQVMGIVGDSVGLSSGAGTLDGAVVSIYTCPADPYLPGPVTTFQSFPLLNTPIFQAALTNYRPNLGVVSGDNTGAIGIIGTSRRFMNISDGISNTVLAGEGVSGEPQFAALGSLDISIYGSYPSYAQMFWTCQYASNAAVGNNPVNLVIPAGITPANVLFIQIAAKGWGYSSGHTGGVNFAFADGSVRFASNAVSNTNTSSTSTSSNTPLKCLSTCAGGEVVPEGTY